MIDAPVHADFVLGICLAIAALVQYAWIGFYGHSIGRWLQAVGFTGMAIRLIWAVAIGDNPPIAAISIPLLIFIGAGSALTALQQMHALWLDVRCFQDPTKPCFRADRIRLALLGKRKKREVSK